MRKTVLIAGLTGLLIAFSLEGVSLYLYHHGMEKTGPPPLLSTVSISAWPTGIILIDAEENLAGFIGFVISALANGMLYAGVAFCVTSVWKKLFGSGRFAHR